MREDSVDLNSLVVERRTVAETHIELTGWKAVVVAVLILGVSGYRISTRIRTVNDEGQQALRTWLAKDYTGRGPKDLAKRVADYRAGLADQPLKAPAKQPDVELVSLSAHGWRDAMIVRTEISVDGGPPPDGQPVRYLFLTTKYEGGWMVLSESDSFKYYEVLLNFRSPYSYSSD
jgi:hypothetical protein